VSEHPIHIVLDDELRRSRLTVFFRILLVLPHFVWLYIWGIAATITALVNWIATLVTGRSPSALHRFLAAYLRYQTHVYAFLYLVGNPFPGFVGREGSYPIDLRIAPPERQNRWTVLFRVVLVVPALFVAYVYGLLLSVAAVLGWFAALFTGKMPRGLRDAAALALRYRAQANGYLYFVTGRYPYSGPTAAEATAPEAAPATTPAAAGSGDTSADSGNAPEAPRADIPETSLPDIPDAPGPGPSSL
jgi:hypothetical protein